MKGAIIGDIIGSAFNTDKRLTTEFQLFKPVSSFTDDTVLTLATADSVINNLNFKETAKKWIERYPNAGYNTNFIKWCNNEDTDSTYVSYREGATRRISPIGFVAESIDQAMSMAESTTLLTHNTPEMIKAAKAVAACIFLAKSSIKKEQIKDYISDTFGYNLNRSISDLKAESDREIISVIAPTAITIFLISYNFEDAIRKAVSLGFNRCNTVASIVGGISEAYYKHIPKSIIRKALHRITPEMEIFINDFDKKYVYDPHPVRVLIGMH
ncbi:ADP-ribosylglycohydrolase family protein [Saccharicrinis aurantiacus]|uniref:ADP-ribosylglycohydrolase family protein n=1 Tax=Saccharicrinis aurantiacus TaxID=1849719 RepID=UPI0024902E73|nr:ADP-ribosylglycohydrolase family protein [Saccharicrinis aurantiacus]